MSDKDRLCQPLVTVFTCVYNRADKIHRVFNSMKKQTYNNIEHVIVDDGSTDELDDLVNSYIESVSYPVIYIKKENGGKHTATNVAWDAANGEYILQLDSDDELLPHAVEYLVNLWNKIPLEKRDEFWCVHGRCMDQINRVLAGDLYPENINEMEADYARAIARKTSGDKIGLMKAEALVNMRYPEPEEVTFVTESILWKPLNKKYRTYYSNEIVYIYYINEGECLSKPSMNPQSCANKCWSTRWALINKEQFKCDVLKELLKYSINWHNATRKFKKRWRYLDEFGFGVKCVLIILFIPSFVANKLLNK